MKKIITMMLLCVVTIGSYAQRVYKEGGLYIIECKGMPEASYTKKAKPQRIGETVNGITGINSAAANKTVAYKFEVRVRNHTDAANYNDAIKGCADKGTNWRLPTLREMQLIWTMHEGLQKLDGFTPLDAKDYWTATERFSGYSYVVFLHTGVTDAYNASYYMKSRVRCIREIIE